jgi:hypothetical protein
MTSAESGREIRTAPTDRITTKTEIQIHRRLRRFGVGAGGMT